MGVEDLPRTIELERGPSGSLRASLVDQRALPQSLEFLHVRGYRGMIDAVRGLAVRGAPAIGIAGACALALFAANEFASDDAAGLLASLEAVASETASARPTAVNLGWGVERALAAARQAACGGVEEVSEALFREVKAMEAEDEQANRAIGARGAALLHAGSRILTHCNTGSLATAFYGTALGIVFTAFAQGKVERVYADETRPVGQGARLTTWELSRVGIPCTLICDDMAASLMGDGKVDAVLVGADRICANGDTANKIGTYGLAVLARHHGIPFYVAAPSTTVDTSAADGRAVVIEQRPPDEVASYVPDGVDVYNPAFDVTPAALITAIITDRGIYAPAELAGAYLVH